MKEFQEYISQISPINHHILEEFQKNEFFIKEGEYAEHIGFLKQDILGQWGTDENKT